MKIAEILKNQQTSFSVELFPPKEWAKVEETKAIVAQMATLNPSFISVTYGAAGGASSHTVHIAKAVEEHHVTALAHLTCVASHRDKIRTVLQELQANGIENVLALRGDLTPDTVLSPDFQHASQLTEEIKGFGSFCVGGACYPEGHPEAISMDKDIEALRIKVASGCDFLTSQMFFDNNIFYAFRYRMLKAGIDVPVIAGIMPVTNGKQIDRICRLSGTMLPPRFKAIVDKFGDSPAAMHQAGIAYATEQIIDLLANGVNHIHLYSMNKPEIAGSILSNLSALL